MNREKITFPAGVPITITMEFEEGKVFASQFKGGEDSVMYTLEGEKIAFVPPLVDLKRKSLGIGRGEAFTITRIVPKGARFTANWDVKRAGAAGAPAEDAPSPLETQLATSVQQVAAAKATRQWAKIQEELAAAKTAQAALQTPPTLHAVTSNGASLTQPMSPQRTRPLIQSAMIAAVDALIVAREYAATQGIELQIFTENVQKVATALYIQNARNEGQRAS